MQAAAGEHDVTFLETDIDRDGGRIVLVAGAPQTVGEDEERLLRTVARDRRRAHAACPFAVGVNRGRVFAGEVGAPFRRTYTILGDTAALAARLMARAAARARSSSPRRCSSGRARASRRAGSSRSR